MFEIPNLEGLCEDTNKTILAVYIYSGIHHVQLFINGTVREYVMMLDLMFLPMYDFILN